MRAFLFDDHSESYLHWWACGSRGLTCVHVDAHLDLMEEGFSPVVLSEMRGVEDRLELEAFRLPEGPHGAVLHCANYLYPALQNGVVAELYWVIPNHLLEGSWGVARALELVGHWVDVPLSDLANWQFQQRSVSGTLFGKPFWIGRAEDLPRLSPAQLDNLAFDLDLDYFVDPTDDTVWRTPYELAELLPYWPGVLTVALSVAGGYTPPQEIFWGDLCLKAFAGDFSERDFAERVWRSGARSPGSTIQEAPALFLPALLARQGRWEEAQELDPRYRVRTQDRAARFLEKRDYSGGLFYLESLPLDTPERDELIFYCLSFLERWEQVRELIQEHPHLFVRKGPEGLKMRHLSAQALVALGSFEEASMTLRSALEEAPENATLWLDLGLCQKRLGAPKKAARSLQKAIRYSRGRVSSLSVLERCSAVFEEIAEPHLAASAKRELNLLRRS